MAFGQQGGPPATARQVQALLALLQGAGHSDFRDARGPMGFTQRQAAGKFTRDEADAFIEQLEHEQESHTGAAEPPPTPMSKIVPRAQPRAVSPRPTARPIPQAASRALAAYSTGDLAAEQQRRGWVVLEP